jgi:ABC-2 type transport system permease protein
VIHLLSAEALRAVSRRVIRLLAVGVIAGVFIGVGIATWHARGASGPGRSAYEADYAACLRGEVVPESRIPKQYPDLQAFCADRIQPEYYDSTELRWADINNILQGMGPIVILLGAFLGATLGGADWTAGTMGTLLTWEPRRIRVLLVRAGVAAVAAFAMAVFAQGFFAVVFRIGVAIAGTTVGSPAGLVGDAAELALRIAAVAALTAIVAHAIATFGRSTVSAVGILFGYLVLVEGFLSHLWTDLQPWLLVRAAVVVVSQEPMLDPNAPLQLGPNGQVVGASPAVLLSVHGAWGVLTLWGTVALLVALAVFRTRDVT